MKHFIRPVLAHQQKTTNHTHIYQSILLYFFVVVYLSLLHSGQTLLSTTQKADEQSNYLGSISPYILFSTKEKKINSLLCG